MMESKPRYRDVAERPVETGLEASETSGAGGPRKRKLPWKPLLAAAIVIVIVWQLYHAFVSGKTSSSGQRGQAPSATTGAPTPTAKPTPTPTVTLGGHAVPATGGASIVLNPGLVSPGGHVGIFGSGFHPRDSVVVSLVTSHSRAGTVVGRGTASATGLLITGFSLPASSLGQSATVVAQGLGGEKASAQLITAGGVGSVTIVGKPAGRPGTTVTINGTGFGPGETVHVFWGRVAGTPAATLTADTAGNVRAALRVGVAPVGNTSLVLIGTRTQTTATAPYLMLAMYPSTAMHPWALKAGHTVSFTGGGFAPGEQVLIYLNSSSGVPALTATANNDGGFSVAFVVPFGLRGKQSLTAIGNQSRAATTSGFSVLPYMPSAQGSTYGAMPGTTISFYATGFAANEVVLVYAAHNQLITAFRVDGKGSANNAGSYLVPTGVNGLRFTLVGQKSGGTAVASVKVTAPPGQVTVPPQPPYVLPPSLGGKPTSSPSPHSSSPAHSSPHPTSAPTATSRR
jgi:hypothetical protein